MIDYFCKTCFYLLINIIFGKHFGLYRSWSLLWCNCWIEDKFRLLLAQAESECESERGVGLGMSPNLHNSRPLPSLLLPLTAPLPAPALP